METTVTTSTERSTTESVKKKRIAQTPQNISQTKQNISANPQEVLYTQSSKHNSVKKTKKNPTLTKFTAIKRSENLCWTTNEKWRYQTPRCWTTKRAETVLKEMSFFEGQSLKSGSQNINNLGKSLNLCNQERYILVKIE